MWQETRNKDDALVTPDQIDFIQTGWTSQDIINIHRILWIRPKRNTTPVLSKLIQNEVLAITSEPPFSEDHFETKFQTNITPYDQTFEKKEEELIEFKEEYHDELRKFPSGPIQNEVITLTSEHLSSSYHFQRKFQAKISPSDQSRENKNNNL